MDANRSTQPATAEWESPEALSRRVGIKADTLRLWARTGKLPAKRIGSLVLFRRADIDEWLAGAPSASDVVPVKQRTANRRAAKADA
jgi:excisionase family DNA binding protein